MRILDVDYASHSPMVERIEPVLRRELAGLKPGRVDGSGWFSTVSGRWLRGDEADAEYWYRNVAACPFIGIDEPCIEDGGFVKLREVSVSYTLDAPWVQRAIGFSSVDIRVSGRNLKTWTKYTGYDPETNLGGTISANAGAGGVDYFNNPQTRSFVFSVTLNH